MPSERDEPSELEELWDLLTTQKPEQALAALQRALGSLTPATRRNISNALDRLAAAKPPADGVDSQQNPAVVGRWFLTSWRADPDGLWQVFGAAQVHGADETDGDESAAAGWGPGGPLARRDHVLRTLALAVLDRTGKPFVEDLGDQHADRRARTDGDATDLDRESDPQPRGRATSEEGDSA